MYTIYDMNIYTCTNNREQFICTYVVVFTDLIDTGMDLLYSP